MQNRASSHLVAGFQRKKVCTSAAKAALKQDSCGTAKAVLLSKTFFDLQAPLHWMGKDYNEALRKKACLSGSSRSQTRVLWHA
jgi:hypothetical protein